MRPDFSWSVSSQSNASVPFATSTPTRWTTSTFHKALVDQLPARTKRWYASWALSPSGSAAPIIAVIVCRPGAATQPIGKVSKIEELGSDRQHLASPTSFVQALLCDPVAVAIDATRHLLFGPSLVQPTATADRVDTSDQTGEQDEPRPGHASQSRRVSKAPSEIDLALPGSIEIRSTRCGKTNCRCEADPRKLRGPCIVWTRKVGEETVTRVLGSEQLDDYQPWFDNAKRLRQLVTEPQTLTLEIVDNDPRRGAR